MVNKILSVASSKGGVGKTSLVANIAGMAATSGYRVLAVDLDPQGDLGSDLGYYGTGLDDHGQAMSEAVQYDRPLKVVKDVRPGLDVVPGGAYLDDVIRIAPNLARRGKNPRTVLAELLGPLAAGYHLILIDCPPGDRYLPDIALCASDYLLIPTRSDAASLSGVGRLADLFVSAREVNPGVRLLGVVMFGIGASATAIQREVRAKITAALGGVAPVFDAQIRYLEAPAREARDKGMLVFEYQDKVVAGAPKWFEARKLAPSHSPGLRRVAGRAGTLAGDYAALTTQVLTQLADDSAAEQIEATQ